MSEPTILLDPTAERVPVARWYSVDAVPVAVTSEARDGERSQRLAAIQELLESAVIASHRIQHALRPAVLDAGLVAALEWLTRGFAERSGLVVEFQSNHDEFEIAPDRAAALYRVAQEALTNVRKHSDGARRVQMQLFAMADEVTLEVTDDGPGFDTGSLEITAGFGVRGMMERARGLGGWAEVSSAPGRGTTVMFSIPPALTGGDASGGAATEDTV